MKYIKLKEIYESRLYTESCSTDGVVNVKDVALLAMRDACNQAIDLCAKNADTIFEDVCIKQRLRKGGIFINEKVIDKQSILKTKDQIK